MIVRINNNVKLLDRIEWIDMAKGYGIILTIWAHLILGTLLKYTDYMILVRWIYTFNMPLFFFLSGFVFNSKYKFIEFVKKKIKSLLIPYIAYSFLISIFYFIWNWINYSFDFSFLYGPLLSLLIQIRCETLWFIACLFWMNIIFYLLIKKIKSMIKVFVILLFATIVGLIYYSFGGVSLPWNIDVCFTGLLFFYDGYLLKNKYNMIKKRMTLKSSILCFICFMIINILCGYLSFSFSNERFDMYYNEYGIPILSYLSAFAGIGIISIISHWHTFKSVSYIGRNSIIYYALHQAVMIPILRVIFYRLNLGIYNIYSSPILRFFELFIIILILTIINEVKIRIRARIKCNN